MELHSSIEKSNCASCETPLTGNYCSKCGEKKVVPDSDFKISKFIEQTVDGFTHLDSKFLKSFILLVSNPGFLTSEYINGRRISYMKPIQIFFIASLIFYFVFPHSSAYFNDISEMNHGYVTNNRFENTFHFNFVSKLQTIATAKQTTVVNVHDLFRNEASTRAKEFMFLIIPFLALFLLLLFRKSYPYYIVHAIFALHSLSFFLLLDLAYIKALGWLGFNSLGDWLILPLVLMYGIHLFFSIRIVYGNNLVTSILKTVITLFLFLMAMVIYRQIISILTLELL